MNNKEEQIKVYVMIGTIIMLLVIFSGVTYAFFSASNNKGSTSIVEVKSGKMTISYADGKSSLLVSKDIQPSNKIIIDKTFTLTGTNTTSGLAMPYKVGLNYVSEFSDGQIHYYIKRTNANANITSNLIGTANQTIPGNTSETGYTFGTLKKGNKYQELATGEFKANTSNQTITFNLKLQFPDTGINQDSEKGKTLTGEIVVNYESETIAKTISKLDKESNGLEIDDTVDKNLRYVGVNPRNYITFNNETWRIVGVFNNITTIDDNGNEKQESLVKIIRDERIGSYSWDSSSSVINNGCGINEWNQADLMYELNCDGTSSSKYCREDIPNGYLSNITNGITKWYSGTNNNQGATYYYSKNIKKGYINYIATARWNLGGATYGSSSLNSYKEERGTNHISNPSDGISRSNFWEGKVALMYPSDYGYASTDSLCRNNMSSQTNNAYNCQNNNWLLNGTYQWTLSPRNISEISLFDFTNKGWIANVDACASSSVRPTLYLKSDIVIVGGTGENENAYIIDEIK